MNKTEAIAWLRDIRSDYEHPLYKEAVDMAIAALREKADKERRYVVHEDNAHGPYRVCDIGTHGTSYYVANSIPIREAAQAIADIYEGVKQ